jgi:hypothetical protein
MFLEIRDLIYIGSGLKRANPIDICIVVRLHELGDCVEWVHLPLSRGKDELSRSRVRERDGRVGGGWLKEQQHVEAVWWGTQCVLLDTGWVDGIPS